MTDKAAGLSKALITIHPDDKAAVKPNGGISKESFEVQFNPKEYTVNKSVKIGEIPVPGLDEPILQFVRGVNEQLTMDLFFDTTINDQSNSVEMDGSAQDVRTKIQDVLELVQIQPDLHAPPRIIFSWGSLSFQALVESVQQKFTLFNNAGNPLRATLTVTFRKYLTLEDQLKKPPRRSADHTALYYPKEGETLTQIAYAKYKDPEAWRVIAEANNIDNPRRLVPGAVLLIPPLS